MTQWADGEIKQVQGSGKKPYELKFVGGVYSCSCPAWRNQSVAIDKRTCKHLKQIRGPAVEDARVNGTSAPSPVPATPTVTVSGLKFFGCACERNSTCDVAHDPQECACAMCSGNGVTKEERIALMEKAVGRKLRPDEKTKLNGPPVLLAHMFEDSDVDPTGWWMSEKLDGVRAWWDGKNFISRQGNIFHAPDWFKKDLPDHLLDGELWMGRKKFQETISVVKSVDAGERWRQVQYVIFDAPHLNLPFEERMAFLNKTFGCRSKNSCAVRPQISSGNSVRPFRFQVHTQWPVRSREHLLQELNDLVADGAEGVMVRKPGSMYEAGRSHTLLKVKPWRDAEAEVIGHEPGKGRHKGRLGALVVRTPEGIEFNIGTGLSDADRQNPPKLGKKITYRFMEKTDAGVPKGASFVCVRDYE